MTYDSPDLVLRRRIADATAGAGPGARAGVPASATVILAGHFAVFTAGGRAGDLLDEPRDLSPHTDMVEFTRNSWAAACDVVSAVAVKGAAAAVAAPKLLVLMDDIQFVRPALPDREAQERLAAALAADYLRRTPTIPAYHHRELDSRGLGADRIERCRDDRWLFSERALRTAAVRRIRAAEHAPSPDARTTVLESSANGSCIIVRDAELGEHTLVHSGNTSCAGGYLELVMQLHERGVRRLVAVVPRRCLGPVTLGARLARSLFGATDIEIANIPSGGEHSGSARGQAISA
jgi:hypothetical protein